MLGKSVNSFFHYSKVSQGSRGAAQAPCWEKRHLQKEGAVFAIISLFGSESAAHAVSL